MIAVTREFLLGATATFEMLTQTAEQVDEVSSKVLLKFLKISRTRFFEVFQESDDGNTDVFFEGDRPGGFPMRGKE